MIDRTGMRTESERMQKRSQTDGKAKTAAKSAKPETKDTCRTDNRWIMEVRFYKTASGSGTVKGFNSGSTRINRD